VSLDALFRPRSVAVFGATSREGTIGHQVVRNLLDAGFPGRVIPVNARAEPVCGLPATAWLDRVPGADLANIAVRAERVPEVLRQCGEAGVRAAILHSAGFAEVGPEGEALQRECLAICRERGIRLLGPNAQGVQNGDPSVRLYATFTFTPLRPGPVSILAQSGGVAELLNLHLWRAGVGIRLYASPGNAADIDLPELLEEASRDPETRVVLLHLEGVSAPDRLLEALSRCRAAGQEVLVLAGGRHPAGREAAASHTGALAASGGLLEALLARSGAQGVRGAREAVDRVLERLGPSPAPGHLPGRGRTRMTRAPGRRVAVVCNAGGNGILALEAALDAGLVPTPLQDSTRDRLRAGQSPLAGIGTVVDLTATAGPHEVAAALRLVMADPGVDGVLLSLVTPFYLDGNALCRAVVEAAGPRPLVLHLLANPRGPDVEQVLREGPIPFFPFPEEAAAALAAMLAPAGDSRESAPEAAPPVPEQRPAAPVPGGRWLSLDEAFRLLAAHGIPCAPWQVLAASGERPSPLFDPPWVLKADLPEGAHKARQRAVRTGLWTPGDLERAAQDLRERFPGRPLVLQPLVPGGPELALGLVRDPTGVHLGMAGAGGTGIEDQRGVRFRLCPLSLDEARAALTPGPEADPLTPLPPEAREALAAAWVILSRLPTGLPGLLELDLNPLIWSPAGLLAVDARVHLLPQ